MAKVTAAAETINKISLIIYFLPEYFVFKTFFVHHVSIHLHYISSYIDVSIGFEQRPLYNSILNYFHQLRIFDAELGL